MRCHREGFGGYGAEMVRDGGGDFQQAAVGAVAADQLEADRQAGRGRAGSGRAGRSRAGFGRAGGSQPGGVRAGRSQLGGVRSGRSQLGGVRSGLGGTEMAGCAVTVIREQERIQSM